MQELIHHPAFGIMLYNALIAWPVWRIMRRAGIDPRWTLALLVPGIGILIVFMVLGHKKWPNLPERRKPTPPKARRTA